MLYYVLYDVLYAVLSHSGSWFSQRSDHAEPLATLLLLFRRSAMFTDILLRYITSIALVQWFLTGDTCTPWGGT